MIWLMRWLSIPVLVIAVAIGLSLAGWLESGWVVVTFSVMAAISLFVWRQAAIRLVPTLRGAKRDDLEPAIKRGLITITLSTLFLSLTVMAVALLIIAFRPESRTQTGFAMAFTAMAVASYSKLGVVSVFARRLLDDQSTFLGGQTDVNR